VLDQFPGRLNGVKHPGMHGKIALDGENSYGFVTIVHW